LLAPPARSLPIWIARPEENPVLAWTNHHVDAVRSGRLRVERVVARAGANHKGQAAASSAAHTLPAFRCRVEMSANACSGETFMEPETDMAGGAEAPTNIGNGVVAILSDLLLRLQRIEVALTASSGVKESSRQREIEQRRGYTTREIARMLRCSSDRIRTMIRSGKLGAVNMRQTVCGKPKFIVMPEHLAAFVEANKVYVPPKPEQRRRRQKDLIDFFPDTWEEYDHQVKSHPDSAESIDRPDGRRSGPRGPVRRDSAL